MVEVQLGKVEQVCLGEFNVLCSNRLNGRMRWVCDYRLPDILDSKMYDSLQLIV